jgi:amino acid transporter
MKSYLKKLEEQIRLRASKPALCDYGGESYTYAQVAEQVEKFHIFFQAAGIRKGDKIALCAQNSARWAIAFLAVNTYEATIVPILPNYTPEGLAQLICHSDSIFLIADAPIWKNLKPFELPLVRGVLDAREYKLLACTDPLLQTAWEDHERLFKECYPEVLSMDDIHSALIVIPVMLCLISFMIPINLKYGAEKARLVMMISYGIVGAVVALVAVLVQDILPSAGHSFFVKLKVFFDETLGATYFWTIPAVLAVLALGIMYLSYRISRKVITEKEF